MNLIVSVRRNTYLHEISSRWVCNGPISNYFLQQFIMTESPAVTEIITVVDTLLVAIWKSKEGRFQWQRLLRRLEYLVEASLSLHVPYVTDVLVRFSSSQCLNFKLGTQGTCY